MASLPGYSDQKITGSVGECTKRIVMIDETAYWEYIALNIIDEALQELTSAERYAMESFVL